MQTSPVPVGFWTFENTSDLTAAQIGKPLTAHGVPQAVLGPSQQKGAVALDTNSYFVLEHGIAANGGGAKVNQWSLMMDIKVPSLGGFNSLLQANPANSDDGDGFINAQGNVGVGDAGYGTAAISTGQWYRLVIVVSNGSRYDMYLDGIPVLQGKAGTVDGRFSLASTLLLCADNDGERQIINLAELRIFDRALTSTQVSNLGGYSHVDKGSILTGPYLQNVKQDGITVMWETDLNGSDSLDFGTSTAYGNRVAATSSVSGGNTWIHKVVLSGLPAGTTFHYRVNRGSDSTPDATFKTAPATAADFSFGVWGDSQGSNPANPGDPMEPTKALMKHMVNDQHVDLALAVGDLAESGNDINGVRAWFLDRPVQILGTKIPFFIAWGNHDLDSHSIIRDYADLPSQDRSGMGAGFGSFSFDYAGCHFICIDNASASVDVPGWVRQDLQSNATKNARFTFVFIHKAPWYDRWYSGETWLRTQLVPYLEQNGATLCFSGHMHAYERGQLNGVHYVTTGGGSWLDTAEVLVHDWPNITVGGYHNTPSTINQGLVNEYVKVEISGNTCTVRMMAFTPDGRFLGELDTFTVQK